MPRKKRVLIIIQLCFAFTYLFWMIFHPFLKEVVFQKSEAIVFEDVMGNEMLFASLPVEEQEEIRDGYEQQKHSNHGGYFANFSVSIFGLSWMILSLLICFFLLFNIEGAAACGWVLPMLILAWGYYLGTAPPTERPDFFPSDDALAPYFVQASDKKDRTKLLDAWHSYLIVEKLHETPVEERFDDQVQQGNFLFNLERVHWMIDKKEGDVTMASSLFIPSALQFIFYIVWNFIFAWLINRRSKSEAALGAS